MKRTHSATTGGFKGTPLTLASITDLGPQDGYIRGQLWSVEVVPISRRLKKGGPPSTIVLLTAEGLFWKVSTWKHDQFESDEIKVGKYLDVSNPIARKTTSWTPAEYTQQCAIEFYGSSTTSLKASPTTTVIRSSVADVLKGWDYLTVPFLQAQIIEVMKKESRLSQGDSEDTEVPFRIVVISSGNSRVKLSLWGKFAELINDEDAGRFVEITNGSIRTFNGTLSISISEKNKHAASLKVVESGAEVFEREPVFRPADVLHVDHQFRLFTLAQNFPELLLHRRVHVYDIDAQKLVTGMTQAFKAEEVDGFRRVAYTLIDQKDVEHSFVLSPLTWHIDEILFL